MSEIQLIAGLGNFGKQYEDTRHNAGFWFIASLCKVHPISLQFEKKFHGWVGQFSENNNLIYVLQPNTYMNESGRAVKALSRFYKLKAEQILIIHDDLDLENGDVRLKAGGGSGGHNGLNSITAELGSPSYLRLRIGIGHPGHSDQVSSYVLSKPSIQQKEILNAGIDQSLKILPLILSGQTSRVMQMLHTKS